MKKKTLGYIVFNESEEGSICQPLDLVFRDDLPQDGLLEWGNNAFLFKSRKEARSAINRTHHYAIAFDETWFWPEKKFCKIRTVKGLSE